MSVHRTVGSPVIQGRFPGGRPTIILPRSAALQPPVAVHVQAAIHQGAPHFYGLAAQQKATERTRTQAHPAPMHPLRGATLLPGTFQFAPSIGHRLPPAVQRKMEVFFGADFSDVRVHVGPQAQQIGAQAFTRGSDLYFAPGQYMPHHSHGQRLLGHELAHVVQQRAGRVQGPFGGGMVVVQDPALEAEAERMGLRAAQAKMRPQTIQRAPGIGDLRGISRVALREAQGRGSEEFQAMSVGSAVVMTANSAGATTNFGTASDGWGDDEFNYYMGREIKKLTSITKARDIKGGSTPSAAAAKAKVGEGGFILMRGGQEELHAEQGLLLVLAHMMKGGAKPGNVIIAGAKPPCARCLAVLRAFATCYEAQDYGGTISFVDEQGYGGSATRLSASDLPDGGDERYEAFKSAYDEATSW